MECDPSKRCIDVYFADLPFDEFCYSIRQTSYLALSREWSFLVLDHLTVRGFHGQARAVGKDLFDLQEIVKPVVA